MTPAPIEPSKDDFLDFDDEEGWQDMPVVREDSFANGLDEEDQRKYHYRPAEKAASAANATGNLLDIDVEGTEWREKSDNKNESEYTRLRANEEDEADEVHLRTKYLFDEDKAMTPLSQMQATKNLLTEAQRIAYVGLCALAAKEMVQLLKSTNRKELKASIANMELWLMKIMGRLYYHMELETQEQKMIESLAEHGVQAMDLVPALMTTHTVANPEYDPEAARKRNAESAEVPDLAPPPPYSPTSPTTPRTATTPTPGKTGFQTTARVLEETSTIAIPGVSTTLSAADQNVTLDIRWTVLCDLFLILIADSVYDARSRVLLENVAKKLGLGWLDVVKFESRVTEALEIQEDVEKMENQDIVAGRMKAGKKKRYMMLGLATLGGGLVIGLSAGLLAPVIGAGLGAAFTAVGIGGTGTFLAGAGGAAVITTGGVLTGSGIAGRGMANRTQQVRTFDILPLHNNKRVSAILTVPGFLNGKLDDPRLPFSVLDPIVGDVFSVLWEPEMIQETGSALQILTGEVLTQMAQTLLQATVMTAFMTALQWPIILTKLGYLIDNPWSNALDRARAAGSVLAHVLMQRHLGVRPITLIGFSLGARVIFYALVELAQNKAFGIVQDVFLLGATLTASTKTWCETRSVVSGRYVNCYARNDWVLNYLFRATSGGVGTVAGLRAVGGVPGLENVDVTDKIAGHMSYRAFMPLILDQLGFPVFADFFDDPEEPDFEGERVVVREEEQQEKKGWFGSKRKKPSSHRASVSRPPSGIPANFTKKKSSTSSSIVSDDADELPPRIEDIKLSSSPTPKSPTTPTPGSSSSAAAAAGAGGKDGVPNEHIPPTAGFNLAALKAAIGDVSAQSGGHEAASTTRPDILAHVNQDRDPHAMSAPPMLRPSNRTESTPAHVVAAAAGSSSAYQGRSASSAAANASAWSSSSASPPPSPLPVLETEIGPGLARSVSMGNMRGRFDEEEEDEEDDDDGYYSHARAFSANANSGIPPPTPPKDPFMGGSSNNNNPFSSYSNPSTTTLASNPFGSGSSWNIPPPAPSSGINASSSSFNPFSIPSSTSLSSPLGSPEPADMGMTFGGAGGSLAFGDPIAMGGLSFGGMDGSISEDVTTVGRRQREEAERWKIPNDVGAGKRPVRDAFNSNPWG